MRIFVAVNRVGEIGYRQTTALLIASLVNRGCQVELADVDAFSLLGDSVSNQLRVHSVAVGQSSICHERFDSRALEALVRSEPPKSTWRIQPGDLILIRTNPGRDLVHLSQHDAFMDFCRTAQMMDVRVINNPSSVRFFASKAALAVLDPAVRPQMIVSHEPQTICEFIATSSVDCVVKPLVGSRGSEVILIPAGKGIGDLQPWLENRLGGRGIVAQHFVPSALPGDKRVIILDGEILEFAGQVGGIYRHPAAGDFRANLHLGGTAHALTLLAEERLAVQQAAELLQRHGIRLAGIDLVGSKIIEFNVYSTGGLFDAIRFTGVDFAQVIVDKLLS